MARLPAHAIMPRCGAQDLRSLPLSRLEIDMRLIQACIPWMMSRAVSAKFVTRAQNLTVESSSVLDQGPSHQPLPCMLLHVLHTTPLTVTCNTP